MARTRIGGVCDWTQAATTYRPSDPAELRAVALDLAARGLTPRDIGEALRLSEGAVTALLDEPPVAAGADHA